MPPLTLTQSAWALGVPPHRLIHLCEKRVVVPGVRDARGRGSSREFSKRNLFEFAIALEMRQHEVPVSYVQAVLRVLRAFEGEAKALLGTFALPDSLLVAGAPSLSLIILDGERLYFSLTRDSERPRVFGGVNVRHPRARGRAMRDSIDHREGLMTPRGSTVRAAKAGARETKIAEPELSELLAHLGRLLAQEYVALLAQSRPAESAQECESRWVMAEALSTKLWSAA